MCERNDRAPFAFDIVAEDTATHARAGILHTPHGDIPTPIFMPVGTKATVKGLLPPTLHQLGTKILLANTYHLSMRPGADLVDEMGGLHSFMCWDGPILTDSGGFQVFSLGEHVRLSDDGVTFRAVDYDGSYVRWTPEVNMDIARKLGADIVMQLDQCPGYPSPRPFVERAVELSSRWAERCWAAHEAEGHLSAQGRPQALFGIVQGGMDLDLRLRSLRQLTDCADFPGFGIGGYSVGESHEGRLNLRNARHAHDAGPLDPQCGCPVCTGGYTRAYLHHLVRQKEMASSILLSMHNIFFLLDLMRQARAAIVAGTYGTFVDSWMGSPAAQDW